MRWNRCEMSIRAGLLEFKNWVLGNQKAGRVLDSHGQKKLEELLESQKPKGLRLWVLSKVKDSGFLESRAKRVAASNTNIKENLDSQIMFIFLNSPNSPSPTASEANATGSPHLSELQRSCRPHCICAAYCDGGPKRDTSTNNQQK